jgi:hypothetical protein
MRAAITGISDPEKRLSRVREALSGDPYRPHTPDEDINPESRVLHHPADTTDRRPPGAALGEPIMIHTGSDVQ